MNTYKTIRDTSTKEWLVEKLEPFFDLPLVLACYADQKSAYAHARTLREEQKAAWARGIRQ